MDFFGAVYFGAVYFGNQYHLGHVTLACSGCRAIAWIWHRGIALKKIKANHLNLIAWKLAVRHVQMFYLFMRGERGWAMARLCFVVFNESLELQIVVKGCRKGGVPKQN